jgi:uncharacterized protein (DUF305 family)
MTKHLIPLVGLAVVVVLAVGCGDSSLPNGVVAADVSFAQGMIPHHQQAIEMAAHVRAEGADPDVRALAVRIEDAQGPEIEEMTGWLEDWGEDASPDDGHGAEHGSTGDGMMTESEMDAFDAASGAELDAMFLEMMIRHHEGAITMAEEEVADGSFPDAVARAEAIAATQAAEIDEMQRLLEQQGSD